MRKTLMTCAVAGLLAAPVTVATMASACADDVPRGELRQDRQDIRRDEQNIRRDEMRERREFREGDAAGMARAQRQETRDREQLRRDEQELARDRADCRAERRW